MSRIDVPWKPWRREELDRGVEQAGRGGAGGGGAGMNERLKHPFDSTQGRSTGRRDARSGVERRRHVGASRALAFGPVEGYKPRPMLRRFLPREEDFFSLFERHAALTVDGAKQFVKLVVGRPEHQGAGGPDQGNRARDRRHHAHLRRAPAHDLHHPDRPRRHPPADHPHGRRHGLRRVGLGAHRALRAPRDDAGGPRARRRAGAGDRDRGDRRSAASATSRRRRSSSTPASR